MLLRISCERCQLGSLWTDDPGWFLETVCSGGKRCEATLVADRFATTVISGMTDSADALERALVPSRPSRPGLAKETAG